MSTATTLVVCLCAEWCGVCRDFRARFDSVAARHADPSGGVRFLWIDVEDEADLVDPLDIDDFPTVLVAVGDEARYFGTLMPRAENLQHTVQGCLAPDGARPRIERPEVLALLERLRRASHL